MIQVKGLSIWVLLETQEQEIASPDDIIFKILQGGYWI